MSKPKTMALRPASQRNDDEGADWVLSVGSRQISLTQWEADELRETLRDARPPHRRTLLDVMWDNLDHAYAALQTRLRDETVYEPGTGGARAMDELRGECRGLATQISVLSSPRSLDDVRKEAHQRWLGERSRSDRTKTKREMRAAR
jgi:hypothetical protein